jgi:hypothetical protein
MSIDMPEENTMHCVVVRRCPNCTGATSIEITGARVNTSRHRHGREDTGKFKLPARER